MSIRRKFSNTSDLVEPLQSTILCEYYLWVRWCNIREINGYYIYNGMKGNKLSFVHQQNSNLIIYFHTIATDIHSTQIIDNTFSFFSSHSYFMPHSSIPENREDDNNREIKLNLAIDSPSSSSSMRHDTSPKFSVLANQSHSNDSTPVSSPPQSPNHSHKPIRLTPKNSIDEYLYNHWVIKHENHILYYTKDKDPNGTIDNEYPPSYGWKYNEKNASSLPKQYNLINFGAPPPGITRIPIIPEPMITFDSDNDKNGIYAHGNFKNGTNATTVNDNIDELVSIPFDLPVHYIDVVFNLEAKQPLPFEITMENPNSNVLQISNIGIDSMPYKVGLKQGDILISLNEEEIIDDNTLKKLYNDSLSENIDGGGMISMTVCRRIYDHIMIIVNSCGNNKCNGKYYFHHLDEFNSPVFMQDIEQNMLYDNVSPSENKYENNTDDYKINETNTNNKYPMIIRKAHYVNETGESLWTISDKTEDFYVGLSIDIMPPNSNWECVVDTYNNQSSQPPNLIFYNGNRKFKRQKKNAENTSPSTYEMPRNKTELLESFAPPSKSYSAPIEEESSSTHYRRPSWKKNQTPWDMELIIEDEEMGGDNNNNNNNNNNSNNNNDNDNDKRKSEDNEWKTKYFTLYENLEDLNVGFYEYWLLCNKYKNEIESLKDVISQFKNRFIIVRKELFEQKRREEDLLDKINSLQTHSRQVSSISALFDDDYKLDIEELQDLHMNINNENENNDDEQKRRDSVKISNEKLDKIALKTEIDDLNVQLNAKDVKIRELEIDISSWQETHSQIYDSFTSATKLYREEVEKFTDNEKHYEEKNNKLFSELESLKEQLKKNATRNSIEKKETLSHRYRDIEAELQYASDSSSSASDTSDGDSPGGGTHVRRSSKPWMQIKQKFDKKRKKEARKKRDSQIIIEPPPIPDNDDNNNIISQPMAITTTNTSPTTPMTPITPITPLSPGGTAVKKTPRGNMLLSPNDINIDNRQSPYLNTIISSQEEATLISDQSVSVSPSPNNNIVAAINVDSDGDGNNQEVDNLTDRTKRLTRLALVNVDTQYTLQTITPDGDEASQQMPTHPTLHTAKAQSKLTGSLLNGYQPPQPPLLESHIAQSQFGESMELSSKMNLLAFRDSNASLLYGRDSNINIDEIKSMQEKANAAQKWEDECKDIQKKYEKLESENEQIISSKLQLLNRTAYEIGRLKNIINVILNYPDQNIKNVITQMLKSK